MEKNWGLRFFELFKDFFIKAGKVFLFFLCACVGYLACEFYHLAKNRNESKIRTISETSVAINERGELLLIDRKDGSYMTYQDSVGISIFELYAKKFQSDYKNPK